MAKQANPEKAEAKQAKKAAKAEKKAARKAVKAAAKAEKKASKAARPARVKKASPVPKGMHTVTPSLVFKDAARAIEWYKAAFDAKEINRMMSPDGSSVWHAEIKIGDSHLYLNDESPMGHSVAPTPEHRPTCSMQLYVKDCDKWFERAVAAGAQAAMPIGDMFWGDRMGAVIDPFNVFWLVATRTRKLSKKQMEEAGREFVRNMAEKPAAPTVEAPLLHDDKPAGETAVPDHAANEPAAEAPPPAEPPAT